ncbi:MAG: formate dehydrogenase [Nitrosomonadales bacterium]|nr:MAG: formate dehydrogenase [Nitrosomonadales bacterium]
MNIQHLVKMANQIGQFFEAEPDQDQAINDIASHLKRFWDPRMRKAIVGHVKNGGEGLLPIVMKAVQENQHSLA